MTLEEKKQFVRDHLHEECLFWDIEGREFKGTLVGLTSKFRYFIDDDKGYWANAKPLPKKKRVPWEREDYKCAPFLRSIEDGTDEAVQSYGDDGICMNCGSLLYEDAAAEFTLPDGTELYKEVDE